MAREYKKIKRIINDFAENISDSESFSLILQIEDDRLLKYAPKQFEIIQREEEDVLICTGAVNVLDLKFNDEEEKVFKLDIPLTVFYAVPYNGMPSNRKIKLEFKGITSEMRESEFITCGNGANSEFRDDESIIIEVEGHNFIGVLPGLTSITIESGLEE